MFINETVWIRTPLEETTVCLPMAEVELDCVYGHVITKAAVLRDLLDQGKYLLGKQTAALFEEVEKNKEIQVYMVNAVETRSQKKLTEENWEKILPQALFALRTVRHDSTGFSPAELVHGKTLWTPVKLLYEKLTKEEPVESSVVLYCVVLYVFELINRMKRCHRSCGNPTHGRCQTNPEVVWVGPREIVQQLSETNYVVKFPEKDKSHVYHVNMLKPYHQREKNINFLCINPLKHDEEEDSF
ncbi:retrovirus-related Pol polyprotein from transposon 412 [Trichonephila clavipes]|nr:retrovirus-related Pol polyprotein from transposon 412 [Trichonephila clavipes]